MKGIESAKGKFVVNKERWGKGRKGKAEGGERE